MKEGRGKDKKGGRGRRTRGNGEAEEETQEDWSSMKQDWKFGGVGGGLA